MTENDGDLKREFEALKAEDARAVRPFAASWRAARTSVRARQRSLLFPAAAAALALLLGAAIAVYIHPVFSHSALHPQIGDISRWQSPTASLLKTPGSELLTEMPRIGEPVIAPRKEEIK